MSVTREEEILDYNERLQRKLIFVFDDKIEEVTSKYNDYESSGCEDKRRILNEIKAIFEGIDWDLAEETISEMEAIEEEVNMYNGW